MQGLPAAVRARPAAEGMATTGLPDISALLQQALAASRREAARSERAGTAAEGMATADRHNISVLVYEAVAASRQQAARGEQSASVAAHAGEAAGGEMGVGQSIGVDAG